MRGGCSFIRNVMGKAGAIISGVVREAGGKPLPGARVYFVDAPVPMPDIAALTNSEGEFALTAPAAGRYRVGCAASARQRQEVSVDVAAGEDRKVDIILPS